MVLPEHYFRMRDGRALTSLLDLYRLAPTFSNEVFAHHVNANRNDFVQWIRDVFFDHALAEKLAQATTKTAFVRLLHEHLAIPLLILNAGSSSVKFQLSVYPGARVVMKGIIEPIGRDRCEFTYTYGKLKATVPAKVETHHEAVELILKTILNHKVVKSKDEILAVGHRVVHGGEYYHTAAVIDASVREHIEKLGELAPLHNPASLAGIRAVEHALPHATSVAIFDTAFHHTIPQEAFLYGLPMELYERFKIRKYGFHGINHAYLAREAARVLGKKQPQLITCHLGNGSSITAIKDGKSVDTSMGFTPLDGIMMGTRSGGLDPEIVLYLLKHGHYSVEGIDNLLNKKSGLFGVSGLSSDFREIRDAANHGDEQARLALKMLVYRVRLFIGSYLTLLSAPDAIVFSGGIGENAGELRKSLAESLAHLGVRIDPARNKKNAQVISAKGSKIKLLVIPAHEEDEIAQEMWELLVKK